MSERGFDRIVVLSDTHMGDPCDTLADEDAAGRLCSFVAGMGPIDELVLLGDVMDFWKSAFSRTLERARPLLAGLFELPNVAGIVFVPGNHDHHILRLHLYTEGTGRLERGERGEPDPVTDNDGVPCAVLEALRPPSSSVPLRMMYPCHQTRVAGREVFLTHGHLLGMFERTWWQPKGAWINRTFMGARGQMALEQMEQVLSPYYEMLALSGGIPNLASGGYKVYKMLDGFGRAIGVTRGPRESARRYTSLEENLAEIAAYVEFFCETPPDVFVFGHTHKGGVAEIPGLPTTAYNPGCWLDDGRPDTMKGFLLEISEEARLIAVRPDGWQ